MVRNPTPIFDNPNLPLDHLQVNLITETIKWSHASPAGFKKWLAAGTRLYLRGISGNEEMSNLTKIEDHFEVKTEGIVQIVNPTAFWVGEVL